MMQAKLIPFRPISITDKEAYDAHLKDDNDRGCEFSFANLYIWGRQNVAFTDNGVLIFSQFNMRSVYPFPVGATDKRAAIEAIIDDAHALGIPCRITGVRPDMQEIIKELFPDRFRFHSDESSFDYVYTVEALAELSGKKYHAKRNHVNKFNDTYKNWRVCAISDENIADVSALAEEWFEAKLKENPNADLHMERAAISRALRHYDELELIGLLLYIDGRAAAFTIASKLSADTLDVHFEKALNEYPGAYAVINMEFAKHVRANHPEIIFLDREEDMGIEGLRRAKRSYNPHHQTEKCWACLLEDGYDY